MAEVEGAVAPRPDACRPGTLRPDEFEALDEREQEDLRDEAQRAGKEVFSLEYDSGGPGGGGYDCVMRHRDLFFVFSLDDHPPGPFGTLHEAIVEGYLTDVTSATVEIACVGMAVRKLLPLLTVHDAPATLLVNGKRWEFDAKNGWCASA